MYSFTANLHDYQDSAGEIDENKIKDYQTAKDILEVIKADSVMWKLITTDAGGKEIIDVDALDGFKAAINSIGGSAIIDVDTYKHKLRALFNNRTSNVNADDDWQNHLKLLSDYNVLNSQLQQALQAIIIKEHSILTTINDLGLGLDEDELTLDNISEKISELLGKPKETLEKIINIDLQDIVKELEIQISPNTKESIKKVESYQELSAVRNSEIKKHVSED